MTWFQLSTWALVSVDERTFMYLFKCMFESPISFVLLKLGNFVYKVLKLLHSSSYVDGTTLKLELRVGT